MSLFCQKITWQTSWCTGFASALTKHLYFLQPKQSSTRKRAKPTFMSRSMSGTSLGSALRNLKLAIFFFYSSSLFSRVLCKWSEAKAVSSSASRWFPLRTQSGILALVCGAHMQQLSWPGSDSLLWPFVPQTLFISVHCKPIETLAARFRHDALFSSVTCFCALLWTLIFFYRWNQTTHRFHFYIYV